jgi:hypothetical protein
MRLDDLQMNKAEKGEVLGLDETVKVNFVS